MIHAVRLRNFKALRDINLALDRFTVLVGPNGSGKTSVLEGIHCLTRLANADPSAVFEGAASIGVLSSRGAEGVFELGLRGTFRRKEGELSVSFAAIEDYPFTDTYLLESRWGDRRSSVRRELHPPEDGDARGAQAAELPLGLVLREAAYLRFDCARLAQPSYSDLPSPIVGPDGDGLAAVLADMAVSRPDDFHRLQDALRAVMPGLIRVRLMRSKVVRRGPGSAPADSGDRVWGHEIVLDMVGAGDIPAHAASEGTLRMLGLFTALIGPERHQLVLLDHIEAGIHPRAQGDLVRQIENILAFDPKLQIVATSDSPVLLDHLSGESIRVHCQLADGSVRIKSLTSHPEWPLLQHDLRPGEFWLHVGEDWVVEEAQALPTPEGAPEPPDVTGDPT